MEKLKSFWYLLVQGYLYCFYDDLIAILPRAETHVIPTPTILQITIIDHTHQLKDKL